MDRLRPLLVLGLALAIVSAAQKQRPKKQAPPPQFLEAPRPLLSYVFPAGGQRGKTIEAIASGTNLPAPADGEAAAVQVIGGGVTARLIAVEEANKARISVTLEPDAEPGEKEIRFVSAGGVSNRFRFFVGQLAEVNESEPNSEKTKPQRIESLPVVVNGQILEGDVDYFLFSARAGSRLVLEVQARRIVPFIADAVPGWFDPCLTLYDSGGKELNYADDYRLKPDPVMFFDVPRDGEYVLEIRDIIYRGRTDFIYRLSIGAVPFLTHIFPLGGRRGSEARVELYGVNLDSPSRQVAIPIEAPAVIRIGASGNGLLSNALPFAVGEMREEREEEPNDSPVGAQRIEPPVTVNGRIQKPGDSDYYVFTAQGGQTLAIEVAARRLESPLDSVLSLMTTDLKTLAENDDWTDPGESATTHHADSRLVHRFTAAGAYALRIRDAQGKGGSDYAYRLSVGPPRPDFALRITPDNPRLGQGETAAVTVNAVRKDGFNGEIRLRVEGLPEGFQASDAVIQRGQNQARLTISAPPDAATGIVTPEVVGTADIGNQTVVRRAETAEEVMQAFAYTHYLPTRQLLLSVVKPAAFSIAASVPRGQTLELRQGTETAIVVKVLRKEGVKGAVTVTAARPAAGITVKPALTPPDKDEAVLTVVVAKEAPVGLRENLIISGVMKTPRETVTRFAPAIPIRVAPAQ